MSGRLMVSVGGLLPVGGALMLLEGRRLPLAGGHLLLPGGGGCDRCALACSGSLASRYRSFANKQAMFVTRVA